MSDDFGNPPDPIARPGFGHLAEQEAAARFATYTVRLAALVQSRLAPRYRARLDPEDVVASAWRSFLVGVREDRWRLDAADLWPLLATLVSRKLLKQLRRQQQGRRAVDRETTVGHDILDHHTPTAYEAASATEALEAALDMLEPLDREVVLLRLRGDSPARIAAATGASERSISRAFADACQSLRAHAGLEDHDLRQIDLGDILDVPESNGDPDAAWTVAGGLPQLAYSELKLTRLIGQGGIGRVYHAVDRRTGATLAVKFLKKQFWKHAPALRSLATELVTVSRLGHPGVARSLGWGRTPSGTPFIASELIEGPSLLEWSRSASATVDVKLERLARVAEVLSAVHAAGIVHGDVTPANIVCSPSGRVVLVDFGLSTTAAAPVARTGATLAFAAPEQVVPALGTIGPWTDHYGFGATGFTVLTGQPLHAGSTRTEITASIIGDVQPAAKSALGRLLPDPLAALLAQCVATRIADRPETMSAVSHDIRALIVP